AEGNPLFTEELVAMLVEDELLRREGDHWVAEPGISDVPAPPTIQALLAARLDRLPDDERALLCSASVEGALFHRAALIALSPATPEADVDLALAALARKDVIRPDQPTLADDDAYSFRHVLIHDTAYRSLPKRARADLHERFAGWLEHAAPARSREFE